MATLNSRLVIPAGETVFGPAQTPSPVSKLKIILDRNTWGDTGTENIVIAIEISTDQVAWQPVATATTKGGATARTTTTSLFRNFATPVPAGTWVRAVVRSPIQLDTRAQVTWL